MNELLYKPIGEIVGPRKDREPFIVKSDAAQTVLCIGDAHFPFACPDTLSQVYAFAEAAQPDVIVQLGDLMDLYSFSSFPKSLNYYNPFEEVQLARKMAGEMWETLHRLAPKARRVQLWGNHSVRPHKRLLESAPELEPFFDLKKIYSFDGVELQEDYRTEVIIQDTAFIHGYYGGPIGKHRDYMTMNCVTAHTHRGGVTFKRFGERTLFELNAGYIGMPNAKVFSYTPQKITHWTPGFGFIDAMGPRFIPTGKG